MRKRLAIFGLLALPCLHGQTITLFGAPGATSTRPTAANPSGVITGSADSHGFVRSQGGSFTLFDAPGQGSEIGPTAISPSDVITGNYRDSNGAQHGFVRDRNGVITTFDPEGSQFTNPTGIAADGAIVGSWANTSEQGGFVRFPNGNITKFNPPGGGV